MQTISESEATIQQRLEASFRMQLALQHAPFVDDSRRRLMLEWLQHMMFPLTNSPGARGLQVATNPARDHVVWTVMHEPRLLVSRQNQLMMQSHLPASESILLGEMAATFSGARFGAWLQLSAGAQSAGWLFAGNLPLAETFPFMPAHEDSERFQQWIQANNISLGRQLRRATGPENQSLEVRLPLLGSDLQAQMMSGLDLFDSLGIAILPERTLAALLHSRGDQLYLSLSLSAEGAVKIGLVAEAMPVSWFMELCELAGLEDASSYEGLAAFQGTLGAEAPTVVEAQQTAQGFRVELHYEMLNLHAG